MKPRFALDLTEEAISLLERDGAVWRLVGRVALDIPDVHKALTGLRNAARAEGETFSTKLVLPETQILYFELQDQGFDAASRRAQVRAALNGRTPYAVEDLVFDFAERNGTITVAAIAGLTLREAEDFAEGYGFHPVSFVAAPDPDRFAGEPFFGLTRNSGKYLPEGARLERDPEPVRVALQPDTRAEPANIASEAEDAPFIEVLDEDAPADEDGADIPEAAELPDPVAEAPASTEALNDATDAPAPEAEPVEIFPEPATAEVPEHPGPEEAPPHDPEPQEPAREEPEPEQPAEPAPEEPAPVEIPDQPDEPAPDAPTPEALPVEVPVEVPAPEKPEEPAPVEIPDQPDERAPGAPAPEELPVEVPAPEEPEPEELLPEAPAPIDPAPDIPAPELPDGEELVPEEPPAEVSLPLAEEAAAGEPDASAEIDDAATNDGGSEAAPALAAAGDEASRPEEDFAPDASAPDDETVPAPTLPGVTTDIPPLPAAFQSRRLTAPTDEAGALARSMAPRLGGLTAAPERTPTPQKAGPRPGLKAAIDSMTTRAGHLAAIGRTTAQSSAASAKAALINGQRLVIEKSADLQPALLSLTSRAHASGVGLLQAARARQKPLLMGAAGVAALIMLGAIYALWPASDTATPEGSVASQAVTPSDTAPPVADTATSPDVAVADQTAPDDSGDVTPPADEEPVAAQEPAPPAADATGEAVPLAPYDIGTVAKQASPEPVTDPFDYQVSAAPVPATSAVPTAAGILMAGGFMLIEGKPAVLPKPRPAALAQKALEARAPKPDPRVVGRKPKPRPANLMPPPAAPTTDAAAAVAPASPVAQLAPGQTPALAVTTPVVPALLPADPKLAKFRPKARPASVEQAAATQKAQAEAAKTALASATKLAVATSPRPEPKPVVTLQVDAAPTVLSAPSQAIDQSAVEAALAEAQTAEEVQAQPEVDAVPQVSVVPEADNSGPVDEPELQNGVPNMPTTKTVAKKSTVKNAIDLGETNLIGVYGSDNSRRALVRLASGRYVKVKIGDRLDGGRVVAIGEDQLSYEKKGRTIVLKMITKG